MSPDMFFEAFLYAASRWSQTVSVFFAHRNARHDVVLLQAGDF